MRGAKIDVRGILHRVVGEDIDPYGDATHLNTVCVNPHCTCKSPDKHLHYYLNLETGMGYCFRCAWGYSFPHYLKHRLEIPLSQAEYITYGDRLTSLGDVRLPPRKEYGSARRSPLLPSVQLPRHCVPAAGHWYLEKRGISDEMAEAHGLLYCTQGEMANRIVVPLYTHDGRIVGYSGRSVGERGLKNLYPSGFPKRDLVYNEIVCKRSTWGVLVEGELGDFHSVRRVTSNVMAVYGKNVSSAQAERMYKLGLRQAFLMLDGGEDFVPSADRLVNVGIVVYIVILRAGSDPGDLSESEIKRSLNEAYPYLPTRTPRSIAENGRER